MSQSKRDKFEQGKELVKENAEEGYISESDRDAILKLVNAYDEQNLTEPVPNKESPRSSDTLRTYLNTLLKYAEIMGSELLEATADEYNNAAQRMIDGVCYLGPKDGYSKSSVSTFQANVSRFLQFYSEEATANHEAISQFTAESSKVNPENMLDSDEIEAMRNAAGCSRNKALFDFLLFTGQRRYVVTTLQWKHLDLESGVYRLNDDESDGLKGADEIGTFRPLLGANGTLRTWKEFHPDSDDPEAMVFTAKPDSNNYDPHNGLAGGSIARILRKMSDKTGIDKPTNPHAMRHNFVTLAKGKYDLDGDVIKRLIGHKPSSNVMETTYSHLSDDDYIKKAEAAFNLSDDDDEPTKTLTPVACPTCGASQSPDNKACPNCGDVFTPDAHQTRDMIDNDLWETKGNEETPEQAEGTDTAKELIDNNPELAAKVVQQLMDDDSDDGPAPAPQA